jgi:hypothetical protein
VSASLGTVERDRGQASSVAWLAALLALLVVVAATSRTRLFHESEPPVSLGLQRLVLDLGIYSTLLLATACFAVLAWALLSREPLAGPLPPRPRPLQLLLQTVLLVLFMALAVPALQALRRGQLRALSPPAAAAGNPGSLAQVAQRAGAPPGFDWAAAGLLGLAVAIAVLVAWRRWRRRRDARRRRRAIVRELAAIAEDTLDDLRLDADPRRAVIQAYARMERVLAAHGLPRRPAEAPHEYLERTLAGLRLDAVPAGRLTDLFELARFSDHSVDEAMRAEAVAALAGVREELDGAP